MLCKENCEKKVQRALQNVEGVETVLMNFEEHMATVFLRSKDEESLVMADTRDNIKDNILNGRTEVPALVHLLQFTTQIVILLVKPQEVKTTKIDYLTVII